MVVPNETGKGGAPLTKHRRGENIATEAASFPHWYAPAYLAYAGKDDTLPYDQHLLLACVAPRALLIEGFCTQSWFDTESEFEACKAASPVWRLLGEQGLPDVPYPGVLDTSAIGPKLGYVYRNGPHGILFYDWMWLMDFAHRNFGVRKFRDKFRDSP